MKSDIVSLRDLIRYLNEKEWESDDSFPNKNLLVFKKIINVGNLITIVLPSKEHFVDYPHKMRAALDTLSIVEGKDKQELVRQIEQLTQLDKAIIIATRAHSGILDKGNKPYIFHALRVAMNVDKVRKYPIFREATDDLIEKVRCACILHDTVEDTKDHVNPVTLNTLRDEGIDEDIVEGVDGLTRRDSERYSEFIERAMTNMISRMSKACDLIDNMDLSRLEDASFEEIEKAKARIQSRYKTALSQILGEDDNSI